MIARRITVLGSTGSVGSSTLDLMEQAQAAGSAAFEVEALTGGANIARLVEQARRWRPRIAVTADPARLNELRDALAGTGVEAAAGPDAIVEAAVRPADWIMASIVGAAGLRSAWAARGSAGPMRRRGWRTSSTACAGPST
jgi:1-deoxy-D-xylulose-5-phosphate reductoisomerase